MSRDLSLAGKLLLGGFSWDIDISSVSYNKSSCTDGVEGGLFQPGPGKFDISAEFSGSYETEDGVSVEVQETFSFLSCTIGIPSGIECESDVF